MAPSLGSMNLLCGSQNSETFSSLDHQLIIEGYNSDGRDAEGEARGQDAGLPHPLQVDLSPAPPPVRRGKPLNPPFWVLTEASLQKQDCLNFQFLSLPGRWGGAVVPPLLPTGSPGNQPLPLGAFHRLRCGSQELVRNIKMPLWLLSLSKCQGPKQD